MPAYFATAYTIHFDDTMAYGSHHFLTAFKFQCAARETFLFGEHIFDIPGARDALEGIHLLTSDAYARNLYSTQLGDRVAILLTLEEWGQVSARFCYRVIGEQGQRVSVGFQTLVCADAKTHAPTPLPTPLRNAMEALREIAEIEAKESFRDRVLSGGTKLDALFRDTECEAATRFLSQRYPTPAVISVAPLQPESTPDRAGEKAGEEAIDEASDEASDEAKRDHESQGSEREAWVFAGQGAYDAKLLSARIVEFKGLGQWASDQLEQSAAVTSELLGGNAQALLSGSCELCEEAVRATPELSQVAIYLQNVLGALLWQAGGHDPSTLLGHSFGEIAALGVSGCFDLPVGVRIVCLRVQAIARHAPSGGGLLAVSSDREMVETEATLLGLNEISIAGRNHHQQTVASGPLDQLTRLQNHMKTGGIGAVLIPSPTSYHHPRLRKAAAHWLAELRNIPFDQPSLPVYSPIGRRFITADEDIPAVLASQLLRPFDLQGGILDVIQAGATKFVDCGSTGALAKLLAKTCSDEVVVCSIGVNTTSISAPPIPTQLSSARSPALLDGHPATRTIHPGQLVSEGESSGERMAAPVVAITGQGCILPGGAASPEQLYAAIAEKRSGIVDQSQFDAHWSDDFYSEELKPDRSTSPLSGRVNDEDIVVPPGIDPDVFAGFTRTQRLLCIALAPCVASLEGAERIQVVIGATADGFEDQDIVSSLRFAGIDPEDVTVDQHLATARAAHHQPHSAVQEVFDLLVRPGLKITLVDAACASSLYAVALGMHSLEAKAADAIIAGGLFCPGPGNSCLFSQFRGTTSTGCRPFDAHADGVVFSEGAALVTLRRLSDARQAGLEIVATVRGVGLSSDGRSSSANVPQTKGQILSLERCYKNYAIDPKSIVAIEGHGTSTPVGDSTELETLRRFFAGHVSAPMPVHSLKGLLGHAGWAAGTASVIAAGEYLRRRVFPSQAGFREPSPAVIQSQETLVVAEHPVELPRTQCRIAIDGFGFGGANAHLVLEDYSAEAAAQQAEPATCEQRTGDQDALVFVAYEQILPTDHTPRGLQFDRSQTKLPAGYVVLPELADDMDISQILAVSVVKKVLEQLPEFDDSLRTETALVLALSGKTERGIEATMRIMTQRLRRNLDGCDTFPEALDEAHNRARPSGPYTLQCMMPNVAAGRAALLLNLNGPNFVVDAGPESIQAAISSAAMLLRRGDSGGTKLAVIGAIEANAATVPDRNLTDGRGEFAAAFCVTTRRVAEERGLKIISDVADTLQSLCSQAADAKESRSTFAQVQGLITALRHAEGATEKPSLAAIGSNISDPNSPPSDECPIHVPVWVEKAWAVNPATAAGVNPDSLLAIVPADAKLVGELAGLLATSVPRFMLAVCGPSAEKVVSETGLSNVIPVDLSDEQATSSALQRIDAFGAEVIVAVEQIESWDLIESLSTVAKDNALCELLFRVGQRGVGGLKQGKTQLWGLFLDAWKNGVHPKSGPVAGLLKSVQREFPQTRCGTLCTAGLDLADALQRLFAERRQPRHELEVVYDSDIRLVRRLRAAVRQPAETPQVHLDQNSVVVATGGARGVTAVMLDAILRQHRCTVIALGRSSLEAGPVTGDDIAVQQAYFREFMREHPGASAIEMKRDFESARARWEAQQSIDHLSTLGGKVEYIAADVTNRTQVEQAVQQIAARYHKIDLVVHGAGVQTSKRLEHRSVAEFRQTFAVKLEGLHNLVECCRSQFGQVVNAHVLTSAYSIFGNDGQHDYGAANEALDRLCALSRLENLSQWSSLAWLAWDGIGMTRGSEYRALAQHRKLSGIRPRVGQRLLDDVLAGRTGSAINVPLSKAEHAKYAIVTVPPPIGNLSGRLLEVSVDLSGIECLPFHKIRNTPTLPGAWILDRFVNAGLRLMPDASHVTSVTVEGLSFMRFVRFPNNQEPNLRVVCEATSDTIDVWMIADVLHPTGRTLLKDVVCAKAKLLFSSQESALRQSVTRTDSPEGQSARKFASDPYCAGHRTSVQLSGPFNCLTDIAIGAHSRSARFTPDSACHWSGNIPSLLIDAAWRVGAMYASSGTDDLFVPVQIGRIVMPVAVKVDSNSVSNWEIRSTGPRAESRFVRWDRTEVLSQDGKLQLTVEDALAKRLV